MKDLNDLRRDRAAAVKKMESAQAAMVAAVEDADAMTAAQAEFDAAEAEFARLDSAVKAAERVEAAQAAAVGPKAGDAAPAPIGSTPYPAAAINPADKGIEVGFALHALANAGGDLTRAMTNLDKAGHTGISAALSGASDSAGGVTVPRPMMSQVIELLRARTVLRRAGTPTFPMPAGQMRNARQTGAATAAYVGENAVTTASEQTFDKVDQSFKTLRSIVPVGNALLRHAGPEVARLVRDDLVQVTALREDLGFLRNDGSGVLPKGLVSWCPVGNQLGATAATAAAAEAAIRKLIDKVESSNVQMVNCGFIMRPEAKNWLASLRDAAGYPVFPSIDQNGTLKGYPIYTTTQLPNNLGAGTNQTEVIFTDFNELMIGDSFSLTIAVSTEASFWDGSAFVSAFSNDMTLMRAVMESDMAPKHDLAISYLLGTSWAL